jgi:hypothetical protein
MKNVLSILLAMFFCLSVVGCGDNFVSAEHFNLTGTHSWEKEMGDLKLSEDAMLSLKDKVDQKLIKSKYVQLFSSPRLSDFTKKVIETTRFGGKYKTGTTKFPSEYRVKLFWDESGIWVEISISNINILTSFCRRKVDSLSIIMEVDRLIDEVLK